MEKEIKTIPVVVGMCVQKTEGEWTNGFYIVRNIEFSDDIIKMKYSALLKFNETTKQFGDSIIQDQHLHFPYGEYEQDYELTTVAKDYTAPYIFCFKTKDWRDYTCNVYAMFGIAIKMRLPHVDIHK